MTKFLYDHPNGYRIENVAAPESLRDVDLALDTPADFELATWLAGEIAADADLDTIIAAARRYAPAEGANAS